MSATQPGPSLTVPLNAEQRQVVCAHCKVGVIQVRKDVRMIAPRFDTDVNGSGPKRRVAERAWACTHCDQVTIEMIWFAAQGSQPISQVRQLWPVPEPRELDSDVPGAIRDRFTEGSRCEAAGAYRGAAAMYRSAVEELCKERGATSRNLHGMIEELRDQLAEDLITAMHETRLLGNDSVHDGLTYSPEEVADVAELIVEMSEILYVAPARRAAMRESRRQRREAFKNGTAVTPEAS